MSFWNHILPVPNAAAHGQSLDDLMLYIHLLVAVLFVGWLGYFVVAVWRFRKSVNPRADHTGTRSHFSTYAEIGVAAVEVLLLLGFAVPLWAKAVDQFPVATGNPDTDPIEIQIMAQQFAWNAHFTGPDNKWGRQDTKFANNGNVFGVDPEDAAGKDDVTSSGSFYIPVNREVICRISSMDVIHCFKVPRLRVTQDAIPGMSIPVHFKATTTGEFMVICAQLCGNAHSSMKGEVRVVSAEEYAKWYAEKAKSGGATSYE